MIDDKSLEKAIRSETKSGLTIYHNGAEIWFIGTGWVARTREEQMRETLRGTMGAIVEMLGHLPEVGAILVRKGKDGFIEQAEMTETVAEELTVYCGEVREILERTPLSLYGRGLWQTPRNKLYAVRTDPPRIGTRDTTLNDKGCIVRRSEQSDDVVITKAYRPECVQDDPVENVMDKVCGQCRQPFMCSGEDELERECEVCGIEKDIRALMKGGKG